MAVVTNELGQAQPQARTVTVRTENGEPGAICADENLQGDLCDASPAGQWMDQLRTQTLP
jgi:hypothetical protein